MPRTDEPREWEKEKGAAGNGLASIDQTNSYFDRR